jgi:hypothetical protein
MFDQLKNYKGTVIILLTILPVGLFFISPIINITVISAQYENDGSINISIQTSVKSSINITTTSSELFDVTIISYLDDSGRVDDPYWGIDNIALLIATIHQIKLGIYSRMYAGNVYHIGIFPAFYPDGCIIFPQYPSEITFVVSIGEDFYSSPFTVYLDNEHK